MKKIVKCFSKTVVRGTPMIVLFVLSCLISVSCFAIQPERDAPDSVAEKRAVSYESFVVKDKEIKSCSIVISPEGDMQLNFYKKKPVLLKIDRRFYGQLISVIYDSDKKKYHPAKVYCDGDSVFYQAIDNSNQTKSFEKDSLVYQLRKNELRYAAKILKTRNTVFN